MQKQSKKNESGGSDESEVGCTFTEYQIQVLVLYYIVFIHFLTEGLVLVLTMCTGKRISQLEKYLIFLED